eukprot:m.73444 g.73444  ORF g.73444 m.73444 type:complete len:326 (+) comp10225_c0_seq2:68-1045(+)
MIMEGEGEAVPMLTSPPRPLLLSTTPMSPTGAALDAPSPVTDSVQGSTAIKMTLKLGGAPNESKGVSPKGTAIPKAKGKSAGKSPGSGGKGSVGKAAGGRSRRQSVEGDYKERRVFSMERTREAMREHLSDNRNLSLEAQYTMAFATEQFLYYLARQSLKRAKPHSDIDYDAAARAVQEVPALRAFLAELVPTRITYGKHKLIDEDAQLLNDQALGEEGAGMAEDPAVAENFSEEANGSADMNGHAETTDAVTDMINGNSISEDASMEVDESGPAAASAASSVEPLEESASVTESSPRPMSTLSVASDPSRPASTASAPSPVAPL